MTFVAGEMTFEAKVIAPGPEITELPIKAANAGFGDGLGFGRLSCR
jgi:hypothetical protein